jgi:hypothetical protein
MGGATGMPLLSPTARPASLMPSALLNVEPGRPPRSITLRRSTRWRARRRNRSIREMVALRAQGRPLRAIADAVRQGLVMRAWLAF